MKQATCYICKEEVEGVIEPPDCTVMASHKSCEEKQYEELIAGTEEYNKQMQKEKAAFEKKNPSTCNMCGETCYLDGKIPEQTPYGLDTSVSGSYDSTAGNGSGALDDGVAYKFKLCEFCLDYMFSKFIMSPNMMDYMLGDTIEGKYVPAKERIERDDWRKSPEEFIKQSEIRNKARKI